MFFFRKRGEGGLRATRQRTTQGLFYRMSEVSDQGSLLVTFPLAFAIGFSVASIPGPTIILIATETLRKGARAGLLTMLAPLLMDAVVMVPLGLVLQASLFSGKGTAALGLIGAGFLIWLGVQSLGAGASKMRIEIDPDFAAANSCQEMPSFLKGVLTHLTSPYPYIYWGTVGSTFIRQDFQNEGVLAAALFPLGFWTGACVFTLLIIYIVTRGKKLLPTGFEPHLHRFSGVLLIGSGIFLAVRVWQGLF